MEFYLEEPFVFLQPIFEAFQRKGFQLYLVGGCVRDYLYQREVLLNRDFIVKDYDLATNALPSEIEDVLEEQGVTVIEKTGGNLGTVYAKFHELHLDISTFKSPNKVEEAWGIPLDKPVYGYGRELGEDLLLRDFTINALAMNSEGTVYNDYNGVHHLMEAKLLKTPQDAREAISFDPLRILRAYRFAQRFKLTIAQELRMAIRQYAPRLQGIAKERIQVELVKIAEGPNPHVAFRQMMEDGVMQQLIPELTIQMGYDQQNPHHHLPLWEHTLSVVEHTKKQGGGYLAVITALLHDVAKPHSFQHAYRCKLCSGRVRVNYSPLAIEELRCSCDSAPSDWEFIKKQFLGHDKMGARMTTQILERLMFSNHDTKAVANMIDWHQRDFRESHLSKVVRRFANLAGHLAPEFIAFLKGDRLGHTPGEYSTIDYLEVLEENLKTVNIQEMVNPKLPINGIEVAEVLGITPGPRLGEIMSKLKEAYLDEKFKDKEGAIAFLLPNL